MPHIPVSSRSPMARRWNRDPAPATAVRRPIDRQSFPEATSVKYRIPCLVTVVGVYVGAFLLLSSLSIAQQRGDAPAPAAAGQRGARGGAAAGRGAPTGPPPRDSQGRADLSGMWM